MIVNRLLPALLLFLAVYLIVRPSRFSYTAPLRASSLKIYRDQWHIPHIYAQNKLDIYFGIGWAEAQDRLLRLFFLKNLVQGTLSQNFGPDALAFDLYLRNLDFQDSAQASISMLDQEDISILQAYSDGINFYVQQNFLPIQFYLLGLQWKEWTPKDSLRIQKFISFVIQFDWLFQLTRQKLREHFGHLADKMFPVNPAYALDNTTILKQGQYKSNYFNRTQATQHLNKQKSAQRARFNLTDFKGFEGVKQGLGSNAFVLSGKHTKDGKPILANDPHLGTLLPSLFYPMELVLNQTVKLDTIFGAIFDGLPQMAIGVKQNIAWATTTLYADTTDLYQQQIKDGKYFFQGQWRPLEIRKHRINVRFSQPFQFQVARTHRGPILQHINHDISPKYGAFAREGFFYSLSSTARLHNDTTAKFVAKSIFFNNQTQLIQSRNLIFTPNIDSVYIFKNGSIGYKGLGLIPKKAHPLSGCYVKNGALSHGDHSQYLAPQQAPGVVDPERGFIVVANNKFAPDDFLYGGSICQLTSARALRIEQMINQRISKGKFDIQEVKVIQKDQKDPYIPKVLPSLLSLLEKDPQFRSQIQRLKKWDGGFQVDSKEALLFALFQKQVVDGLFPNVPEPDRKSFQTNIFIDHYLFDLINRLSNSSVSLQEERAVCGEDDSACLKLIKESFKKACLQQKDRKWGDVHQRYYINSLFDQTPINFIWNRRYPFGGNCRTPNVASYGAHTKKFKHFDAIIGASFRLITNLDETYFILDSGMSEKVWSSHYTDLTDKFLKGEYLKYQPRRLADHYTVTQFVK